MASKRNKPSSDKGMLVFLKRTKKGTYTKVHPDSTLKRITVSRDLTVLPDENLYYYSVR